MLSRKQKEKLAVLINSISENIEYFKNVPKQTVDTIEEFYLKSQVITKNEILNNISKYVPVEFASNFQTEEALKSFLLDTKKLSNNHDREVVLNKKKWILETTTGSTGKPFTVLKSQKEKLIESKYLFDKRKLVYSRVSFNNGFLLLQPTDEYLKNICYRGNTDKNMDKIFEYLLKTKPQWILTTTLLLRKLYKYIYDNDRFNDLKKLDIKFIETTSQALDYNEKIEIENAFNTKIVDQYGCREVWNIAYECSSGNLHINNDYLIVDVVDENGKILEEDGAVGDVILTSLIHSNFPFIKYYLGDRASISKGTCTCGLDVPRICFEGGRKKDKLVNTNYFGTVIFRKLMRYMYFKHSELNIGKVKIIQDEPYSLSVYAEVAKCNRKKFEAVFLETLYFLVEACKKFKINFDYNYCFTENPNSLKEEIFETKL